MQFEKKLKDLPARDVWREYCGFLDLSVDEYMVMQKRLLEEQIRLYADCGLGKKIFGGKTPKTMEEFRKTVPLTTYEDYADVLLMKRADMLPRPPVVWLETTWESGDRPVKVAPYCEEMLKVYQDNLMAGILLATSDSKGSFTVKSGEKMLYGLAPLPYATGLFPVLVDPEIKLNFMPPLEEAKKMSFSQQSKAGFKMGMQKGIDLFFGMSSVVYSISKNFGAAGMGGGGGKLKSLFGMSPAMMYRLLKALYKCKRDGTELMPADLFRLKGFVCVGTDSALYKDELERMWGRRPLEVMGGTETSCVGTETWSKDGLIFFPDTCFYEFIPENEMYKNIKNPSYQPRTYLMNELVPNQNYEIVVTVLKGGAFVRYRVGDVYRCLRLKSWEDQIDLPYFQYVDRVPTVIDIAGFTRITERSINKVIEMSRLQVADWFALKEYDENNRSFLHLYVEVPPSAVADSLVSKQVISEHLSVYFKHFDHDYNDLKRLLGIEPLQVTMLPCGTMKRFKRAFKKNMYKINPPKADVIELMRLAFAADDGGEGGNVP